MAFDCRLVEEKLTLSSSIEIKKMQFIHSVPLALYRIMRASLNQWTFTPCTVTLSQHEAWLAQRFLKWGLQVIAEVCQLTEEYLTIILLIREDWLLWTYRSHHCTTVCRIDSIAIIPEITDIKHVKVAIVSCSCWYYMCSVGSASPCEQCRLCAMLKEMHATHYDSLLMRNTPTNYFYFRDA